MVVDISQARMAFSYAPRLTHDRVDRLTPTQQAAALHEFVDLYSGLKRHVFNPGKNPHTRVLAMATLIDQSEKAAAKHKDLSEPQPFWAGSPDQDGSFAARVGLGQNFISKEYQAYERAGLVARSHRRSDNGNDHIDLAVLPPLLSSPELLPDKGERPRKPPVRCRSCGSEVLVKEVRTQVVCACCGTIHSEHKSQTMVNEPEEDNHSGSDPIITREVTITDTPIITREVTITDTPIITREVTIGDEDEKADSAPQPSLSLHEIFEAASVLLVEIAGDESQHAEMNQPGKKYGPVRHAFTLDNAHDHLSGKSTRAARIRHQDGTTRAICIDADTAEEWVNLEIAAQLLHCYGYQVLLEVAPSCSLHPGGGHLWIIYDGLVNARCAWKHVCELVPTLATFKEHWPGPAQNVRLPGGLYVTPDAKEQCTLSDVLGLVASTRKEIAEALLAYQTPSAIVPDYPPDPEPTPKKPREPFKPALNVPTATPGTEIAFTAGQLAAWFNERNRCEDILPPAEHGALLRAFPTWREHGSKPNVVIYPKTNTWCDYGDGQRGGDALELYILASGRDKKDVLSDLGRAYRAYLLDQAHPLTVKTDKPIEARETLQGALSALEPSETLFSCQDEKMLDVAPTTIYNGPYAPPQRASMCCQSFDWQWNEAEEKYVCGACHPQETGASHAA